MLQCFGKQAFYEFFIMVDSIEKSLDIHLAVSAFHIRIDLDEAARKLLTVKRFRVKLRAVVEI